MMKSMKIVKDILSITLPELLSFITLTEINKLFMKDINIKLHALLYIHQVFYIFIYFL